MGIDVGTGGVRVGLFDRQGSPAVFSAAEFATHHPHPGWAEQDPEEWWWWSCLTRATRGALEESGVPADEMAGVSVDATASTVVASDADGRHLRPAIMWMDVRRRPGAAHPGDRRPGAQVQRVRRRLGVDPYTVLSELAAEVPVGSEGLVVVDCFQGNRSPYTDPHARGPISGLSLRHGPGHLFRAILEGICYGTELILATLRRHDFELRSIVAAGGATRSELWMQLHADVATAAAEMVHVERTIEPEPDRHEQYGFYMDRYADA